MDFHQGLVYHALYEGAHGVDLFFVISGFCLSYPILKQSFEHGRIGFDVTRFFCRRIIRIVPAFWIAFIAILFVSLAVLRFGGDVPWPTIKIPTFSSGVNQLLFLNSATNLCGSFWTLAIEFRWYIVFPLIMWLYVRSPLTIYALGVASFLAYHFTPLNQWDFGTLPVFLLGIVAADAVIRKHSVCRFALPLFVVAVLASLVLEPKGHLTYALQNQIWWQFAAFFFVLAGSENRILRSALSHPLMVAIGLAAYSIYLYHDPVEAWYGHYGGQNPVVAAIAGVLIGVVAWMLVERHLTKRENRDRLVALLERPIKAAISRLTRGSTVEQPV
jgi:peptidoglycan/LPS O-acetylase OafA/YrhL